MRFTLRRLGQALVSMLILFLLVFGATRIAGDPVNIYLPVNASQEAREEMREELGLNRPLPVQIGDFLADIVTLEFGESIWQGRPAIDIVLERLPVTIVLALISIGVAALVAVGIGVVSATHPGSRIDQFQRFLALFGASVPDFWLALMLILVFASMLGILPTSGFGGASYLILPVIVLAARPAGVLSQVVRNSLLTEIDADYAVAARSRGASSRWVVTRHAIRNASLPSITVAGDQLIQLVNGAVVVETVFGLPGIGSLSIDAIQNRDFTILFAIVFVVAVGVILINLTLDVAYMVLDPRVRY
jgi:peptide/nickel transport system permease protein